MALPGHISALEQQALSTFTQRVRGRFPGRVASIQLFGSRARGTGREDSDLDVFVSLDAVSRSDRAAILDQAFDVGLEYGLTISPLVGAASTWRTDSSIGRAIQRDGIGL